ncbi:MAG: tetratricopeptide repeat protein [Planctomycetota bacterium]|nr:tetratricopeptide repeat protein [Planctomycetota bacterium]
MRRITWMILFVPCLALSGSDGATPEPPRRMELELLTKAGGERAGFLPAEPIEARLLIRQGKDKPIPPPQLALHIGQETISEQMLFGPPRLRQNDEEEDQIFEYIFLISLTPETPKPDAPRVRFLLEKPGQYPVWVEDRQSGQVTNRINVTVQSLDDVETQKAFEAYKRVLVLDLGKKDRGTTGQELDKFLEQFGSSPYAPLVRVSRGIRKIDELKTQRMQSKEDFDKRRQSLAALAPYFEQALAAKPNSSVEYRAQFYLAMTKAWGKDYAAAKQLLRDLLDRFPAGPNNEDAKKLLKEVEGHLDE